MFMLLSLIYSLNNSNTCSIEKSSNSSTLLFFLLTRLESVIRSSQTACIPENISPLITPTSLTPSQGLTQELEDSNTEQGSHVEWVCHKS